MKETTMNRQIIKLNGTKTQVVSGAVEITNNSPMPETVRVTINFPDVVFKWMRPRSMIPKREKEFTIRDIVEIDSKLCLILKDGRNLGAGSIPEDHDNGTMLANELMLAREEKTATPALSKRQQSKKSRAGKLGGRNRECGPEAELKAAVKAAIKQMRGPGKYSAEKACEIAMRQYRLLHWPSGWRGLYYHVKKELEARSK